MIKESAVIARVEGSDVWVETQRRSTCGQCAAKTGCGSAALSEVLGVKRSTVRVLVDDDADLSILGQDDEHQLVEIGLNEQQLLKGSFAVYAVPVLLLLCCLAIGHVVVGELGASLGLGCAVVASVMWLRWFNRRVQQDGNYQPRLITPAQNSSADR